MFSNSSLSSPLLLPSTQRCHRGSSRHVRFRLLLPSSPTLPARVVLSFNSRPLPSSQCPSTSFRPTSCETRCKLVSRFPQHQRVPKTLQCEPKVVWYIHSFYSSFVFFVQPSSAITTSPSSLTVHHTRLISGPAFF